MKKYSTGPRTKLHLLFERNAHRSFSAQDIYEELAAEGVSKSAIYRNLAEMEQEGLLYKLSKHNSSNAFYQYVKHEDCRGLIHLKCQSCDATFHLDKHLSQMVLGVSQDHFHFQVDVSAAFLFGLCEDCTKLKAESQILNKIQSEGGAEGCAESGAGGVSACQCKDL